MEGQSSDENRIKDNEFANTVADNAPGADKEILGIGTRKKKNFLGFVLRIVLVFFGVLFLGGVCFGGYVAYQKFTLERTILSFLPDSTEYFARITIDKNHDQVKLANELVHRFPGIDKLAEQIKPFFHEILRQPLDPFEPIFSLADKEIFLAKISEKNKGTVMDQLINIIETSDAFKVIAAGGALKSNEKINLDSYTYEGKQISHAILSELENSGLQQFLGPIPYKLTIPFSKEAYFTDFDNFLISSDRKEDIESVVNLANSQSSLLRNLNYGSILEEKSFKSLSGLLPESYLFEFYQKQKAIPNVTQFPGEFLSGFIVSESFRNLAAVMPFYPSIFSGDDFSSPILGRNGQGEAVVSTNILEKYAASLADNLSEKIKGLISNEEESIHDLKIGRAFTLTAEKEGIDFSTIQEQYDLSLAQFFGAKELMFDSNDLLADKMPRTISGGEIGIWFEVENLAGQIDFADKLLGTLINDAPDDKTRDAYMRQKKAIDTAFDSLIKGLFRDKGVTRDDLLEILGGRFAFFLAPKFGGAEPAGGLILQGSNISKFEEAFSKISFESTPKRPASDYKKQSDLSQIVNAAELYYSDNGYYPSSMSKLAPRWLYAVPVDPDTGKPYDFGISDGGQSYWVEATLSDGTKIVATRGSYPGIPSLPNILVGAKLLEEYNGAKIYSLSHSDFLGNEKFIPFWIVGADIAILSIGRNINDIKAVYDFYISGDSSQSLGTSDEFRFEKARTPGNIGMLAYIKPYSFWGLAEYIYKVNVSQSFFNPVFKPTLEEAVGKERSFVIKSYLKTADHLYGYTSGDMNAITSSLFFRIKDLPESEKVEAEQYISYLIEAEIGSLGSQKARERNSQRISNLSFVYKPSLDAYYAKNKHYPLSSASVRITKEPLNEDAVDFLNLLKGNAMGVLFDMTQIEPGDFYYEYKSLNNGRDYVLTARLEEPYNEYECDRTITQAICVYSIKSGN